jgi:hypothetical protein
LDYEESRESIEILIALIIPDVGALTLSNDRYMAAVVVGRMPGEMHPEVIASLVRELI